MQGDNHVRAALQTACAQLNHLNISSEQRKNAENVLLAFRMQDAAWGTALSMLDCPEQSVDLILFAAQTIRFKIVDHASKLPQDHLLQLLQQVLHKLSKPHWPAPVLSQLCLATAALAALIPSWTELVEVAHSQLPRVNSIALLASIAEEGCSDWRHISIPAFTSSQHVDWATATRERFRSWSPAVLHMLLAWLLQSKQDSAVMTKLLSALTAWVQLGALHQVPQDTAWQAVQAGLMCIQSRHEQEVDAGLKLLLEVPEYAPEQLLMQLQPSMIQMAEAACQAASASAANLAQAAAWIRAFAAYATAAPQLLLQQHLGNPAGSLLDALLHVSALPHLHEDQLLCLPALEAWSSVLERCTEHSSIPANSTADAVSTGSLAGLERANSEGDGKHLPAAVVRSCVLLLLHTVANWLQWQSASSGRAALQDEAAAMAITDVVQVAHSALGFEKFVTALVLVWTCREQQLQQSVAAVLHVNGCSGLLDQSDLELLSLRQQQQLNMALQSIAVAPAGLQLHAAVMMAVAAVSSSAGSSASNMSDVQQARHDESPQSANKWKGAGSKSAQELVQLLSAAAATLQKPVEAGMLPEQQRELALNFCLAVKGWSSLIVELFTSPTMAHGGSNLSGLFQLMLTLAASSEDMMAPAAAAVRAVSSAALAAEWSQLHLLAPLLMQALQQVIWSGSAEQDLLASLSSCLAAPAMSQQQGQNIRISVAQQLLQPGISCLAALIQRLQAGTPWPAVANPADSEICHHLMCVRAVLEGRLLLQQRQQKQQQRMQQLEQALEAHAIGDGSSSCDGIDRSLQEMRVYNVQALHAANALADRLANTDMDEDGTNGGSYGATGVMHNTGMSLSLCNQQQQPAGQQWGPASSRESSPARRKRAAAVAAATIAEDPPLQLLLDQMWPQLHHIVTQHNACGKFLHVYGKCCSRLIKIQPALLMPQMQQFLQAAVAGMVRPGGCSLAEPFAAAIEACCMQGSGLLLDSAQHIMQALSDLCSLQAISALEQSGGGDARPDLAEQVLKLYTSFAKHGSVLHPNAAAATILQQATAAAVACASCCHRKVASSALSLLSAVLVAASHEGPQKPQLLNVVCGQGAAIVQGVFAALLAPSPLSRLQKATGLLLDLAAVADQVHTSGRGSVTEAVHGAAGLPVMQQQLPSWPQTCSTHPATEQHKRQAVRVWLDQGAFSLVPGYISKEEASQLATDCAGLLCGGSGVGGQSARRSYLLSRKLKKRLREFAEKHMKHSATLECA